MPKVSYADLHERTQPLKLKLKVEFQRNGEPYPRVDSVLGDSARRILRRTGLIVPADSDSVGSIRIVVNNFGDLGEAAAKGTKTAVTLGLSGSTVMDGYEMTVSITLDGKTATRSTIRHALYTTIGNATLPPNADIVPSTIAFDLIIEQMLLRALQDMQKAGELSHQRYPRPVAWQFIIVGQAGVPCQES